MDERKVSETDKEAAPEKAPETLEQEIARLGEHFPQIAAALARNIRFLGM